jgi:hypothetical protein
LIDQVIGDHGAQRGIIVNDKNVLQSLFNRSRVAGVCGRGVVLGRLAKVRFERCQAK